MVDVSGSHNVNVIADVVFVVVGFDHAFVDGFHVADVAEYGQADLLAVEDASVSDFDGGLEWHGLAGFL
jgi:hypothetical protein